MSTPIPQVYETMVILLKVIILRQCLLSNLKYCKIFKYGNTKMQLLGNKLRSTIKELNDLMSWKLCYQTYTTCSEFVTPVLFTFISVLYYLQFYD